MRRPLVSSRPRAFQGETREKPEFYDPSISQDYSFVPGYSDIRRRRDAALSKGREPDALPFRLQWVRTQSPLGRADMRAVSEWKAKGYKPVTAATLAELHLEAPIAGEVTAEGYYQNGDVRLFWAPAEVAARHEENWHRATEEAQSSESAPALERAGREVAKPGEDLTFSSGTRVSDDKVAPPEGSA